ncbi:Mitochondrial inner membrane organizing system component [Orbilia brochopaga]|uniref:MICOS complex subunit MIC10 n=1 Tax=Orbilia brochopaga TaxID=3140254 RepID=A0AAV9UFW7_9PEZI
MTTAAEPQASSSSSGSPPSSSQVVSRVSAPVSETLLNDKWDLCLSNAIIKSGLGLGFGIVFSVLLFKRRAFPAWVGLGFGAGRGYAECDASFKGAAGARNVRA